MHDSSDILGQENVPTGRPPPPGFFHFSIGKAFFISIVLWGVYVIARRIWRRVLLWRERSSRLATRRRHGIPDSDLRPFNVAYSDAMIRRSDEEKKRSRPSFRPQPLPPRREAQLEQSLRLRAGLSPKPDASGSTPVLPMSGSYKPSPYDVPPRMNTVNATPAYMEHYNPRQAGKFTHAPSAATKAPLARHRGYANVAEADVYSDGECKKRALDGENDEEHEAKKKRVEGDELIDGDEDAEFDDSAPRRGSKRGLREAEGEEVSPSKTSRGKRARQVSREHTSQRYKGDQSMEVDEDDEDEDEISELKSITRGKKRDRAEAGSTFGGDEEDSAAELELEDSGKARRRRRKRRTVAKRKSEASYARGKKRDADDVSDEGNEEDDLSSAERISSHKRKSKRHEREHDRTAKSDISVDESITSTRTKVRDIGEEWESNGVKYKIGLNNQRLRQALVKKARQKFVMPKDSQHPDRDANLEVYVECWLTEEEYQDAKKQHLLAWQDPPSIPENTEKLTVNTAAGLVTFPQQTTGKSLLWSSSTSTTPTISPASSAEPFSIAENGRQRSYRDAYRHSIATSVGLPISPFTIPNTGVPSVRRIASNSQVLNMSHSTMNVSMSPGGSPGLGDSRTGAPRYRTYSKWEKQELEANAMMRMRAANRKKEEEQERERERKAKEEKEQAERAEAERQRQERERQEKEQGERVERERQQKEKEKADVERKAMEASASVPQITVTAPSSGNLGEPGAASGAAPSSAPDFFKNEFTTSSKSPSGGQPSGFFSLNNAQTKSGGASASQPPKANSGFSFGPPGDNAAPSSASNTATAAAAPAMPNTFSFANASPLSGTSEQKDNNAGAAFNANAGGSSLLSRLGPQAANAPQSDAQPASQGSPFGFNKQEGTNSNPFNKQDSSSLFSKQETTNPFGRTANNPSSVANNNASDNSGSSSTAASTPKFSFGFSNKVNTATSNVNTNAAKPSPFGAPSSSSSLNGALGSSDVQKTSTPLFGFKTPSMPATASNTNTSSTPTAPPPAGASLFPLNPAPKINFSTSTSAFGNSSTQNKEPAKSVFGSAASAFGNNTGSSASPFGGNSTANGSESQNVFAGGNASGSVFGGNSNNNAAANANKPAEPPKPLFSFAAPSNSNAAANSSTPATKPTFSFSNAGSTPSAAPATTTPAATPGASPFSFKFGAASTGSSTPAASPFGAPASSNNTSSGFGSGIFGTATQQK